MGQSILLDVSSGDEQELVSAGQWSALPPGKHSHPAQAAPTRVPNAPDRAQKLHTTQRSTLAARTPESCPRPACALHRLQMRRL